MSTSKVRKFSYNAEYDFKSSKILVSAESMRNWEQASFGHNAARSLAMMELAAAKMAQFIIQRYPEERRIIIVCGAGNNAGDGYAMARFFWSAGCEVQIFAMQPPEKLGEDAKDMAVRARELEIPIVNISSAAELCALDSALKQSPVPLIVDALMGTGLQRPLEGLWRDVVQVINAQNLCVASVDLPSGLGANDGKVWGEAIIATHTLTLGAPKLGLFINLGPEHAGDICAFDIGLSAPCADLPRISLLTDIWQLHLARRPRRLCAHKGLYGHALLVGGAPGMTGAINLAAYAALRGGAGLVTVGFAGDGAALCPELMSIKLNQTASSPSFEKALEAATVIACGPGLGRSPQALAILETLRAYKGILVLDADALWALAQSQVAFSASTLVLTPHIGEAAHLLGVSNEEVINDSVGAAKILAQRYNAMLILKSHTTLIAAQNGDLAVSARPNPAMVGPGFGDALTGVVAAQLACAAMDGIDHFDALCMAVCRHANAGQKAAALRGMALCASDLIESLAWE